MVSPQPAAEPCPEPTIVPSYYTTSDAVISSESVFVVEISLACKNGAQVGVGGMIDFLFWGGPGAQRGLCLSRRTWLCTLTSMGNSGVWGGVTWSCGGHVVLWGSSSGFGAE
uniref:Translocon-associated protein subunit delta n=1 Tax=Meleagris gallopavo TaxID=9103 RepID=A0A803Y0T1_MELGA